LDLIVLLILLGLLSSRLSFSCISSSLSFVQFSF
jgi:hypothetical protein